MTVETINKNKISVCLNCKLEIEFINFLPKEKQIKLSSENIQKISQGNNNNQKIVSNIYNTMPNYNFINISNTIPNYNYQNIDSNNKIIFVFYFIFTYLEKFIFFVLEQLDFFPKSIKFY